MQHWNRFYIEGLKKEEEFAQLFIKQEGGTIKHASKQDDINNHIDLIWLFNNHEYYFDVKGLRKHNRSDLIPDEQIQWVELQNVKGQLGWLYGKSHYIVFERINEWWIIKRIKLVDFINSKITNKIVSSSKALYTCYQRAGRHDIIVKISMLDLKPFIDQIIPKL